ncbi:MAG: deoxyguanosinetriphosphate triphosphohydrolase [Clostridia bacterium]|nr:deoxyguanosinetriphosphate triphosphohydrolase [Clostridia bacterium]
MILREKVEEREASILAPWACLSRDSRGREREEPPCRLRTAFQRDRDRIIHCKAFRRLKHKTQVFIAPEGDHYRTRLTHTLEVSQVSRTIARALGLNEDLTEAIALGHDLGHTPFGHAGEEALNEVVPGGFKHNEQSLRVVDVLERLNLTWEVRDGILNHTGQSLPATLEGQVVRVADRIAYINHDIDDALRAGILAPDDLPQDCLEILGFGHRERINTMVIDLVEHSWGRPVIKMSAAVQAAMDALRDFLFRHVYIGSLAKAEEGKAKHLIKELYAYLVDNPDRLPEEKRQEACQVGVERYVCDYIAGMTDNYVIAEFRRLFVPTGFKG